MYQISKHMKTNSCTKIKLEFIPLVWKYIKCQEDILRQEIDFEIKALNFKYLFDILENMLWQRILA